MGASRGYIPRTFLRKLGAGGARPAWFVLFLAAAATAAAWAGALVLLLLLAQSLAADGAAAPSWVAPGPAGGFLLLWDMAVLWYHLVYLVSYRLGLWDGDREGGRLVVWDGPLFMALATTARLLWLVMKYVAAPMLPFLLAATFRQTTGIGSAPVDLMCLAVLLYPALVLLAYAIRSLAARAGRPAREGR